MTASGGEVGRLSTVGGAEVGDPYCCGLVHRLCGLSMPGIMCVSECADWTPEMLAWWSLPFEVNW